MCEFVSHVNMI